MTSPTKNLRFFLSLLALAFLQPATGQEPGHHSGSSGPDSAVVRHRFEDAEAWAKRFEDPARDAWQQPDRVVELLAVRQDLVVADIGSATGYFPVRFARACPGGLVLGADIELVGSLGFNDINNSFPVGRDGHSTDIRQRCSR